MSLFADPTWADLVNAQIKTFAADPLYRAAAKSWAYYTGQAYEARYGQTLDSPYWNWNEEIDGKRPVCMPLGKIVVDSGAEFLFGNPPRVTVPADVELEKLVSDILDQNDMDVKLLPLARQAANEGGVWLKWAWTPQVQGRPVAFSFLSPYEVKATRDPLDADQILSLQVRLKFQGADRQWYLYQEVWTPTHYTVYHKLRTQENDDSQVTAQFKNGEWPHDPPKGNPFGMIPFVQVYNRRMGSETDGIGDLWMLYPLINRLSHTFWLEDRSNQWDGDPITAILNAQEAPDQLLPGDVLKLNALDEARPVDIKRLVPENQLRQWMQQYANDVERMALDSAGADRINPSEVTNKGNLTREVMELIFHRSVKTALEKQANWGKRGLGRFLERMLLALSRLPDARGMLPALAHVKPDDPQSYAVVLAWPSLFEPTPEERTATLTDLITAVDANLLSWERAVEMSAELFGVTDVATLKEELVKQKAESEAKEAELAAQTANAKTPSASRDNPKSEAA